MKLEWSNLDSLKKTVLDFPGTPGVYLMKNSKGEIIYIGKALNLKARVLSYFNQEAQNRYQIRFLLGKLATIDYLITNNEKEALLLENSLIKKHKPRYNIHLKDDKSYLSLKLTCHDFSKLEITRQIKKDGALYFGPYAHGDSVKKTADFIYKHFKLRTCSDSEFLHRSRPCLEYQIGRCSAPCVGKITFEDYACQVEPVKLFLSGKNKDLLQYLKKNMAQAANHQNYEEAARIRDLIYHIETTLEKQQVMKHGGKDQDVIVFYREGTVGVFGILNIRQGALVDSHYYPITSFEDDETFVLGFLESYYLNNLFLPDDILIHPMFMTTESIKGMNPRFPLHNKEQSQHTNTDDLFSAPRNTSHTLMEVLSEKKGSPIKIYYPQKGEKKDLLALAYQNVKAHYDRFVKKTMDLETLLQETKEALNLPKTPKRIECYDISNISGKQATASRVVFTDGVANKKEYRHYKIRLKNSPDDYAMMHEVLMRRFSKNTETKPDLLMVDGGRGQLSKALDVLNELKITDLSVIGIAKGQGRGARAKGLWNEKKEEEIYLEGRKNPLIFRRGSAVLLFLQRIRDESHRFALRYHHHLRDQNLKHSFLDDVKGLGPVKKRRLYQTFGDPEHIIKASIKELMQVEGINRSLAQQIKQSAASKLKKGDSGIEK